MLNMMKNPIKDDKIAKLVSIAKIRFETLISEGEFSPISSKELLSVLFKPLSSLNVIIIRVS